jgi:5,5'-dehydrodivanillate O-demethylase oxygenase subunit
VQESVPTWYGPIQDEQGRWITSHVMNQDFVAWAGQGRISDRMNENLGLSDRGVAMMRRQFMRDIDGLARGEEPKGIIRDQEKARNIRLPIIDRAAVEEGMTVEEIKAGGAIHMRRFIFQAGQPEEVRLAQERAMGVRIEANKGFVDG